MQGAAVIIAVMLTAGIAKAAGDPWWWPPESCIVDPQPADPTDPVTITLGGFWPNICPPDFSQATVSGNTVFFDVGLPPVTICGFAVIPWQRSETVGPLAGDIYTVVVTLLNDDGSVNQDPTPLCQFLVETRCAWDLDGDGVVNVLDLIELIFSFGPCDDPENCPADFNGDGFVNVLDLIELIDNAGPCPGFDECPWDIDGDGEVGSSDLVSVLEHLGPCDDPANCPWDFNGDDVVDGADVLALVVNFGPCP